MEPSVVAILAVLASLAQVAILRVIDYYFPKGHTAVGDRIAAHRAQFDDDYEYDYEEEEEDDTPK
jgi:exonuclease III